MTLSATAFSYNAIRAAQLGVGASLVTVSFLAAGCGHELNISPEKQEDCSKYSDVNGEWQACANRNSLVRERNENRSNGL